MLMTFEYGATTTETNRFRALSPITLKCSQSCDAGPAQMKKFRHDAAESMIEIAVVFDDFRSSQVNGWNIGVSKCDRDRGDPSGSCSRDIGVAIADHDRSLGVTTCHLDRTEQMIRMRLTDRERIPASNCREMFAHIERGQQFLRKICPLVRANDEASTARTAVFQHRQDTWERAAVHGYVGFVVSEEVG